ncbi:MAG TPA: hypothetical protein VJ821_13205 [Anaerolineales bacterium]|nr:hypothetical protein [Anaerolineales bacterium]
MSTVWVGAGYTFGALAITTMLRVGHWRSAIVPIISTWPFSVAMLLATLLHWDRFFTDTIAFYVWLVIYAILPVALPVIWWQNRDQDPGPQPGDVLIPKEFAWGAGILGIVLILVSLLMILRPDMAARFWPWQLTPLMSRVIGGWVSFIGTGMLCLLFERRYIAYRYFLPSAGIWMMILFIASFFHTDNFNFTRAGSWLWFILTGVAAIAIFGISFLLEQGYRNRGMMLGRAS